MDNKRIQRINTDIFRVLTEALQQKVGDDNLANVQILRVETTADLSEAKVYVSGGLNSLEKAAGYLRNEIAQRIRMKKAPALRFVIDKGVENAARVEEILAMMRKK